MIVAIDVTGKNASIAWRHHGEPHQQQLGEARPSGTLLPALKAAMGDAEISKIGVVTGPGSFTGIRTGIATALGLKSSLGVPVLGFNKFELMAFFRGVGEEVQHFLVPGRGPTLFYGKVHHGRLVEDPIETRAESLPKDGRFLSTIAVDHPQIEFCDVQFSLVAVAAMEHGLGESTLTPLYIRPADTRMNPSLIEKLLAGQ